MLIGSVFILGMVVVKLLVFGREKRYLNLLLATAILGIIWYLVLYLLTKSGAISKYPVLFNKGLPFYYLIAPCFYLYIRGSLDKTRAVFKKNDLLHLLIIIPAIIAILPYNLASSAKQEWVVNQVAGNFRFALSNNKYIISKWHWFTFPFSALLYTIVQLKITFKASKDKVHDRKIIKWIYLFSGITGIIFLGMLTVNLIILFNPNQVLTILNSSSLIILLCLSLLLLCALFFINPALLYGFVRINQLNVIESEQQIELNKKETFINEASRIKIYDVELVDKIEHYMQTTTAFRKTGLTLNELAVMLNVPNRKLSDIFNNYYKLNFNSYINNLRINYIKKRLNDGEWRQFTLEAIANDAGFSSRNTFFVAFKKQTGITPSAYLTALKQKVA